jgi:thiamine-monophosphate kinase
VTDRRARRGASEAALIAELERVFRGATSAEVRLGIGDDAAVLRAAGGASLVWTVDCVVEGVHFERSWLGWAELGRRASHAAVSDIAAMGAEPVAMLSALVLPAGTPSSLVRGIGQGQARASRELGCPVVGGNISRGPSVAITTTVLGRAARPLRRFGAKPGDELWLVGAIGGARAGLLSLLAHGRRGGRDALAACQRAWRLPRARVAEGRRLVGRAHACVDVSDGLAADARHLADASGVRLVVDSDRLVAAWDPRLASACRALGVDPGAVALEGGEDYALLAAGLRSRRPPEATPIGRVERGKGAWLETEGHLVVLRGGFDHMKSGDGERPRR